MKYDSVTAEVAHYNMNHSLDLVQSSITTTWIALSALLILEIAVLVILGRIFAAWWRYSR